MSDLSLKSKFEVKDLELNALLEVTQAINNNVPEESLYKIFNFILRSNLDIKRLALYVYNEEWSCKVNFGTEENFLNISLPESYGSIGEISDPALFAESAFREFSMAIPISHKKSNLAMVFLGGLDQYNKASEHEDGIRFIRALSNIIVVAVENKKLARRQLEQEAFRKELEIASDVQQFLFPEKLPDTPALKVEASYLPHDMVGGDYYDYIQISKTQFLICVADVSGKGIPAALMMSNFQASLHTLLRQTQNLRGIVEALNYQVLESAKGEKFITFFGAIYDKQLHTLTYINCGHNPPILCQNGKQPVLLEEGATVLGAMNPLPFIHEGHVPDLNDFLLFCYTDGLTETLSEKKSEYGFHRVLSYLSQKEILSKKLKTLHHDIIVDLDTFKGKNSYRDDITMLSCRVSQ